MSTMAERGAMAWRSIETARRNAIERIARLLYENGEMNEDGDGGLFPTWDELLRDPTGSCMAVTDRHREIARHLIDAVPADRAEIASLLIASMPSPTSETEGGA